MTKTKTNGPVPNAEIWNEMLLSSHQFAPEVELMLIQYKIAVTEMPRQRAISAILDAKPSLEWLVAERRRQFATVALQYSLLQDEQRDEFCNGLLDWWRLWRRNEDLAKAEIAEHKRRGTAA
jgi:hypothetical protein